ncbi:hypothetical protein BGZ76_003531 [Entomortierella beljakovae]|nr:hypothetical protein BGZ76_003531 [Entomortierella beljakovae]
MTKDYQDIQLDGQVKKVLIRQTFDGRSYVLVEDIRDAFFYFGDSFEVDGVPVPFLEDDHHVKLYPHRIASYPGKTLTIIPVNQVSTCQETAIVQSSPATRDVSLRNNQPDPREQIQALLDAQTKQLMEAISSVQDRLDRNDRQLLMSQRNIEDKQDKLMGKMDTIIANTEAIITQTFELHEYTLPRLFIVLPEVAYRGLNPARILSSYANTKFRLYFLCECGNHTSPTGPQRLNHIHIARHEGYEINRPTEFFSKYGPHMLRLLRMLKFGMNLASGAIPALCTINAMDLPEAVSRDIELKVTACMQYLADFQKSLDNNAPQGEFDGESSLDEIVPIEGADLRRLESFLEKKDQERAFGNLFRTVDDHGHVKWICLDHYRSTYHLRQDHEFENEISVNQGDYDKRLGIVTVVLQTSEAIDTFLTAMTRAGAFNELDVHLRNYSYKDLKKLSESLSKTNVSKLTLTGHQYKEISIMCKKKLSPVLSIMAAGKVRHFRFKDIKDLVPSRGIDVPERLPTVRSLELSGISIKDGHELLGKILHSCHDLAVFRLTDTKIKSNYLKSVMDGLSTSKNLRILSLHNCEISSDSAEILASTLGKYPLLSELDLSQNDLDDSSCCDVINAVGSQLEKLSLSSTYFGNEAAMALERDISGDSLKHLDISYSTEELGSDAMESIIRLIGRLKCTALLFPRVEDPADDLCARAIGKLDTEKLERLEIEGSTCGDQTAVSLARMFTGPQPAISTLKVDLPRLTLTGAQTLGDTLPGDCQIASVSFGGSGLFRSSIRESAILQTLFANVCTRLTHLTLSDTAMDDEVASVLSHSLQGTTPACRLEHLDISENKMTPAGGIMILEALHHNVVLQTLRMESQSFTEFGSMGNAAHQFLRTNRSLRCFSVSHVNLCELTFGLSDNENTLLSIEAHYVDGQIDDVLAFGDLLKSSQNTLLRLVVRQARVCDDESSLEHLSQSLKQNQTIVDLEWDYDPDYDSDNHVLQRYLDRNRDLWRKKAGAKEKDLVLAGVDPWTVHAISRGAK